MLRSILMSSLRPRTCVRATIDWRHLSRARLYSTPADSTSGIEPKAPVASSSTSVLPANAQPSSAISRPRSFEPTPALKRLLRGGERPVPMPYSDALKGKKLIAVPVKEGEEPLYVVAPDDLPRLGRPWIRWMIVTGLFVLIWAVANIYLANNVKLSSSVVQTLIYNLRTSPTVAAELGRNVKPVPFFLEIPRIQGQISTQRGIVDISFDIEGSLGEGKVFFTSVRRKERAPFEIVRWRVVLEDGRSLNLKPEVIAAREAADEAYAQKMTAEAQ